MLRIAEALCPARVPEMVAVCELVTFLVFTVKVAEVLPAGIVTFVRTVAFVLLLASVMDSPPTGAALLIFTVPVLE